METLYVSLLFFAVIIWALVWKGLALWRAARENKRWFIFILIFNSAGFLEIVYLYWKTKNPHYLWFLGVALAVLVIMGYLVAQDPELLRDLIT